MAGKRFTDAMTELMNAVGAGRLVGRVVVDQRYAEVQERREDFKHPRGGQARYLRTSLMTGTHEYMQRLAADAITPTGSDLDDAMQHNVETVARRVTTSAPVDLNNLRRSAHPTVVDDDTTVYDRPPVQRRLTDSELRRRRRRR